MFIKFKNGSYIKTIPSENVKRGKRAKLRMVSENKFKWFYKTHTLSKVIDGQKFVIEYYRDPFWAYEEPTLKLFLKKKINWWHGNVWKEYPNGSRIAAGFNYSTCCKSWFPRKYMRAFLNYQAKHYIRVTEQ